MRIDIIFQAHNTFDRDQEYRGSALEAIYAIRNRDDMHPHSNQHVVNCKRLLILEGRPEEVEQGLGVSRG